MKGPPDWSGAWWAAGLFGRMLVQRNDVGTGLGQKAAYRRDQAGAVGTSQQEPADILGRGHPSQPSLVGSTARLQGLIPAIGRRSTAVESSPDGGMIHGTR